MSFHLWQDHSDDCGSSRGSLNPSRGHHTLVMLGVIDADCNPTFFADGVAQHQLFASLTMGANPVAQMEHLQHKSQ
jgi:hypothetical protein